MALKNYFGSCTCEKVRFEVKLDLAEGTGKCNCTLCGKQRFWFARVKPDCFRVTNGEQEVSDYGFDFGSKGNMHHLFCKNCGVHLFKRSFLPGISDHTVSVNLSTLDNATPDELAAAPVKYLDGLHDNWLRAPEITKHL